MEKPSLRLKAIAPAPIESRLHAIGCWRRLERGLIKKRLRKEKVGQSDDIIREIGCESEYTALRSDRTDRWQGDRQQTVVSHG
ncbi:MAG: hypothetical protein GDA43_22195 [Hormoscilla sp. SP5CHS1]|nr:hypothetical protein [Hormoscilla sp. SP5CHS1]